MREIEGNEGNEKNEKNEREGEVWTNLGRESIK